MPAPTTLPAPRTPDHYLSALVLASILVLFGGALVNRFVDLGRGLAPWLQSLAAYFLAICLEAVPFILAGALLSALLELWLPQEALPRLTARLGWWGVPAVALLAPVFPVCECGVVMVARGLMRKGLPLPHAVAYLLAAPIVNPTVLASTYIAFQDLAHPLWRALGGLTVSVLVGWAVMTLKPRGALSGPQSAALPQSLHDLLAPAGPTACAHDHGHALEHGPAARAGGRWQRVAAHLADDFAEMMPYFLAGVLVASLIKTFAPSQWLVSLGAGPISGPLAMMALAAVLSLCSEADAFVAASFGEFAFPAQTAFLVLGPMFDLKLLVAYRLVFSGRFILLLSALVWLGVALFISGLGWLW